jgi:hypothetical protein
MLEVKALGEHKGISKVHGWQWGFWLQMKLLPSSIGW